MANAREIANDLAANARYFDGTAQQRVSDSFRRGAQAIRELLERCDALERLAEEADARLDAYKSGDDLHGG